ncbi:hypothetical protein KEC55_19070 [Burkholderia cepacia]|uniref:hypothetical protein n=1 Tax=Burkholderia cepacia TaxID=292 RepID=UPI00249D959A|nr:hypothetical protein [Burkholderia cepacia]WGY71919.1 hypothetical protein KEC55_19070 [Burkholderia cepacia]
MKQRAKKLRQRIKEINESFDKSHYLELKHRSIESLYKILRYKSIKYKEEINLAQAQLIKSEGFKEKYSPGELVACTIAGRSSKSYCFGTSHKVLHNPVREVASLLSQLGKIGKTSNLTGSKNIIGKCAEVKSANGLFSANRNLTVNEIEFTPAIRPRTLENIPRCPNCTKIFGKEL